MGMNKESHAKLAIIKQSIVDHLETNGNMTSAKIRTDISPDCSNSTIEKTLNEWRIEKGIPIRGQKIGNYITKERKAAGPVKTVRSPDSQVNTPPRNSEQPELPKADKEEPSPSGDTPLHNFSCAGKVPVDVYQKFKVIAAYRNESARSLIGEWMSDYVEKHKGVFKEISALADD
jgi:hypothetical protein